MLKRLIKFKLLVEGAVFAVQISALTVLSALHKWKTFGIVAFLVSLIFILIKYADSTQFRDWLNIQLRKDLKFAERFGEFGIAEIYNMQVREESNQRNADTIPIIEKGYNFGLSGSTGASYIDPAAHRHWDALKKRLDEGCSFRLLLTDPFCPSKKMRNDLNNVIGNLDPKLNLFAVQHCNDAYSNFEVRFTPETYCSVFFSEEEMIYDPYHLGQVNDRLENYFFTLRLNNVKPVAGTNYYLQLRRHFDYLWHRAEAFEDFVIRNKSSLKGRVNINELDT